MGSRACSACGCWRRRRTATASISGAPPVDSSDHDGEGSEEQLPVGFDLLSGSSSGGTTVAGEATVELGGERGGEREQREQGGEREQVRSRASSARVFDHQDSVQGVRVHHRPAERHGARTPWRHSEEAKERRG